MAKTITIFISYAHKDDSYLKDLQTFLKPSLRDKTIEIWTDKNIVAGQKWDDLVKAKLHESEILLFLVSPDFLDSDYINNIEITKALENEKLVTIPIIIRPIEMSDLKVNYLQVVPTGAKPVAEWDSKDRAWLDVVSSLRKVFKQINSSYPQDDPQPKPSRGYVGALRQGYTTDTILKGFFVALIALCVCIFFYGVIKHDDFYSYTSLGGIGVGSLAYYLLHRQFSH